MKQTIERNITFRGSECAENIIITSSLIFLGNLSKVTLIKSANVLPSNGCVGQRSIKLNLIFLGNSLKIQINIITLMILSVKLPVFVMFVNSINTGPRCCTTILWVLRKYNHLFNTISKNKILI